MLTGYFISVNGSIWVEGGSIEYSDMHEAAPYLLHVYYLWFELILLIVVI